ncbi:MAG: AzlC family ABC transporter permease [Treponema sp.]|nr:AzlC family ABC transporter permease [Treponema sp.]
MSLIKSAFRYSIPVLLGYIAIGMAFGLLLSDAGYPVWLALFMSLWMYAGAGQYIAVGLFVSGTAVLQACLVQLVVNARHIAYGLSMINRFPKKGPLRPYLIFSMTDETFALLSSVPSGEHRDFPPPGKERDRFMFYVAILDQCYWAAGSLIGAAAGSLIPYSMDGIGFALTALFIVLFLEQVFRISKPEAAKTESGKPAATVSAGAVSAAAASGIQKYSVFAISAAAALAAGFLFPDRFALLAGMVLALILSFMFEKLLKPAKNAGTA